MQPFASAIRKDAVSSILVAVLGIPIGLACAIFLVKETMALGHPPTGLMTLAAALLAGGAAYNALRTLTPETFRIVKTPQSSPLYAMLMTKPNEFREVGGVVGRRNVVRIRMSDNTVHTLHVGRDDVEPVVRFLFQCCPYARPFQGP